ncbi:MAG: phenylacetate-CoA oxygenase subunit PaaI [Woeseia sp.]|nr:phenylacetate-CoA oxygenase subunit PaaI [Woeseia sp.]|tara:strand:- start:164 stop:922 length:759 start_codon:yes stop_codon:yes gene_type:complete
MTKEEALLRYILRLGDNALILGQRLVELVAHGPELEEEIANANFSLDYFGQARMLYSYAGELEGKGRMEDDFAFKRTEAEFCNLLLIEQPNGHFGDTIVRSVLFEEFYHSQLDALTRCNHARLAEIAALAIREIRYHLRHNSQWLIRLGDGTKESGAKAQASLEALWHFTGEMFEGDEVDQIIRDQFNGPKLSNLKKQWKASISSLLKEARLAIPVDRPMHNGGRSGRHTDHFEPLIKEMQYMQRTYPGLTW